MADAMSAKSAKPVVSVVMPLYNGERYLREAVESVLAQTFADFELIAIDDASTDGTARLMESYDDPRIRLLRNEANLGLVGTLNRGLGAAAGAYVARMDQDDVSLPERFAKQVAFMDSHPEVAACGTWARHIDAEGRLMGDIRKAVGRQMDYEFWRPSPLFHSSAMIRVSQLGPMRYDPEAYWCEDYDLWLRLRREHRLDNLPEFLLLYRIHGDSMSMANMERQMRATHKVFRRHVGLDITFEEFRGLIGFSRDLNPVRLALLRRRLAAAIGVPRGSFLREDLAYAKEWLAHLWKHNAVRTQLVRPANHLRLRMERRRADASPGGKGAGRAS